MTEAPRSTMCLTFDFDAISLWIGPFAASPSMISRGEFGVVGGERILRLLARDGIPATFFVTGHTAETYPERSGRSLPPATRSDTTATCTRTRSVWRLRSGSARFC